MTGRSKKGKRGAGVDSEDEYTNNQALLSLTSLMKEIKVSIDKSNTVLNENLKVLAGQNQVVQEQLKDLNKKFCSNGEGEMTDSRVGEAGTTVAGAGVYYHDRSENLLMQSQVGSSSVQTSYNYISHWKDLGGNSVQFRPDGSTNPVKFLNKLAALFLEAEVPAHKQLGLATNALRDSAADWGELKQSSCRNFSDFKKVFLERYWGIEVQREVFRKLQYDTYDRGSRADYFLKRIREASYLDSPPSEAEIIDILINHFEFEIRRGIISSGYRTIDAVESYLRRVDQSFTGESNSSSVHQNAQYNNNSNRQRGGYNFNNNNSGGTNPGATHNSTRRDNNGQNVAPGRNHVGTLFPEEPDDLLQEPEVEKTNFVLPIMRQFSLFSLFT